LGHYSEKKVRPTLKVGVDRETREFYPDRLQQIPTEQSERDEELST
jgi:hypothetical protein